MGRNCYLCVCVYVRFIVVGSFFFFRQQKIIEMLTIAQMDQNGALWVYA